MGCGLLAVSMHATLDRENFAAMVWYDQIEGERAGEQEVGEGWLKGERLLIRHTRVSVRNYQLSTAQPLDTSR